jgi:hypothetical protein
MSTYRAPLRDMQFVLRELAGLEQIGKLPGYEDAPDVIDPILEEASTFATEVLDPLNQSGDREGCTWKDGVVTTPKGFKEAYAQFAKAGWIGLPVSAEHGGQGLPQLLLGPTPTGRASTRVRSRRSSCSARTRRSTPTPRSWSAASGPAPCA